MSTYHATPYDISATGFYFESLEDYRQKAATHRNEYGEPVEEYEIQFIDGSDDNCALFEAVNVSQATLHAWFEEYEDCYTGYDLIKVLYLVGDYGMNITEIDNSTLDDVIIFEGTATEYAEQFLEDTGIFEAVEKAGLNPFYVDVESYARDMMINGSMTTFEHEGNRYIVEYLG